MPSYPAAAKPSEKIDPVVLAKKAAAEHALLHHIQPNMRIALGSGSSAEAFIRALAASIDRRPARCIASSRKSEILAQNLNLPIVKGDDISRELKDLAKPIEIIVDGADEIDQQLRLIKGGGGCLLREKILAQSSAKMLVVADNSKMQQQLGNFPLPVEIDPFAAQLTIRQVVSLFEDILQRKGSATIRGGENDPIMTDGGHLTLDCAWQQWHEKAADSLAEALNKIPGVLEHGLFTQQADIAVTASVSAGKVSVAEKTRDKTKG